MSKFDLHLHTDNSDGSDTPEELLQKIKQNGIKIFSVTDHDTTDGAVKMKELNIDQSVKFIYGLELTCKGNGIKSHILGYSYNPDDENLQKLIQKGKILRREKLETRIKYLRNNWNIELTKKELDWLYSRKSVVKTHIANILVQRNLASDNLSAMAKYLDGCKTGNTRFDSKEAIETIVNAGGKAIWAHPLGGEGESHLAPNEFLPQLEEMMRLGIQGLECYYSRYNIDEINFLLKCAKQNNLFVTGGSDYHGKNKTVSIGQLNVENVYIDSEKINLF